MYFPTPYRDPPQWYWKMPLRWRQRYCRWFVWKWEAAYWFFTNILSCRFMFGALPRIVRFSWFCRRMDAREGRSLRESWAYIVPYWRDCWRLWYYMRRD